MKVEEHKIAIKDLVQGFKDDDIEGVVAYNGQLDVRPKYQREWVYKDGKAEKVIESILDGYPISIMYWAKRNTGAPAYEVLDGQQRTISICRFYNGGITVIRDGNRFGFYNLTDEEQKQFLDYKITVYICDGTEKEKLKWFTTINIAGEQLTDQELRNATYAGPWLTSAKQYFSKPDCGARKAADKYIKADWIRQEGLETALKWISKGDIIGYMSEHQQDEDAIALWEEFEKIINWINGCFPKYYKQMKGIDWGKLYYAYSTKYQSKDADKLAAQVEKLMGDEEVSKKSGIFEYVLGGSEKCLSLRTFDENQKRAAYEKQGHKCPLCQEAGDETEYEYEEMQGDHKIPWSKGGRTTDENLQMLCVKHNLAKSGQVIK